MGLCHSVWITAWQLAHDLGLRLRDVDYVAAGINHMSFYLRFQRDGEDLYPALHRVATEGRAPEWNLVRYEVLLQTLVERRGRRPPA